MTNPLFMRTDTNQQNQTEILYYYNDHLGTPQALRDKGGQLHWLANYSAFGEADIQTLQQPQYQVTQNLRFPGQYYDLESGLHQNYFRDYEVGTGRYIETDPIGLLGGVNQYTYVSANPLRYIDRLGLKKCKTCITDCFLTYKSKVENLLDDVLEEGDPFSQGCEHSKSGNACTAIGILQWKLLLKRFTRQLKICINGCKPENECDSCGTVT
jgi:RHS repeat-associated protein